MPLPFQKQNHIKQTHKHKENAQDTHDEYIHDYNREYDHDFNHNLAPFNNLKSIEKDLADVLLLWSSTLALGLVEEGILSTHLNQVSKAG